MSYDGHIDEITGLLFLDGELDSPSSRDFSAHLSSCPQCAQLFRVLQRENIWLREALVHDAESLPARLGNVPGGSNSAAPWAWIAALGAAAAGAYTLWSGVIDPWLTQASDAGFNQGNVLTMLFFSGAFWKGWDTVQNMTEVLSMATVGVVLAWLLHRRWRRFTVAAVLMTITLSVLALSPSASAAEVQHGDPNYTLESGQEVKTDLFVAASHTRIDGDVDGDLVVSSRSLTVDGHIKGDVLAFSQEVHINGPVDGNIRVFAQSLDLNSTVGKNVMVWAQEFDVDEKARVGGTVTLGSSNAQLDGDVGGDLLAFSQVLDVNGSVGGDATVRAQRLRFGPDSKVEGHIRYRGGRQPAVESGARLAQPQIAVLTRGRPTPDYASPRFYWRQVLSWAAAVLFGLVLFLIAPAFFRDVENSSNRFGLSLGLGVLFFVAIPVAAIIACLTIVGLGLGIATAFAYLVAIYAAQVFIGEWLGEKMLGPAVGTGAAIGRLAFGIAILHLLRLVPVAGRLVGIVVILWGLGALVLAIHRRLRPQFAPAV